MFNRRSIIKKREEEELTLTRPLTKRVSFSVCNRTHLFSVESDDSSGHKTSFEGSLPSSVAFSQGAGSSALTMEESMLDVGESSIQDPPLSPKGAVSFLGSSAMNTTAHSFQTHQGDVQDTDGWLLSSSTSTDEEDCTKQSTISNLECSAGSKFQFCRLSKATDSIENVSNETATDALVRDFCSVSSLLNSDSRNCDSLLEGEHKSDCIQQPPLCSERPSELIHNEVGRLVEDILTITEDVRSNVVPSHSIEPNGIPLLCTDIAQTPSNIHPIREALYGNSDSFPEGGNESACIKQSDRHSQLIYQEVRRLIEDILALIENISLNSVSDQIALEHCATPPSYSNLIQMPADLHPIKEALHGWQKRKRLCESGVSKSAREYTFVDNTLVGLRFSNILPDVTVNISNDSTALHAATINSSIASGRNAHHQQVTFADFTDSGANQYDGNFRLKSSCESGEACDDHVSNRIGDSTTYIDTNVAALVSKSSGASSCSLDEGKNVQSARSDIFGLPLRHSDIPSGKSQESNSVRSCGATEDCVKLSSPCANLGPYENDADSAAKGAAYNAVSKTCLTDSMLHTGNADSYDLSPCFADANDHVALPHNRFKTQEKVSINSMSQEKSKVLDSACPDVSRCTENKNTSSALMAASLNHLYLISAGETSGALCQPEDTCGLPQQSLGDTDITCTQANCRSSSFADLCSERTPTDIVTFRETASGQKFCILSRDNDTNGITCKSIDKQLNENRITLLRKTCSNEILSDCGLPVEDLKAKKGAECVSEATNRKHEHTKIKKLSCSLYSRDLITGEMLGSLKTTASRSNEALLVDSSTSANISEITSLCELSPQQINIEVDQRQGNKVTTAEDQALCVSPTVSELASLAILQSPSVSRVKKVIKVKDSSEAVPIPIRSMICDDQVRLVETVENSSSSIDKGTVDAGVENIIKEFLPLKSKSFLVLSQQSLGLSQLSDTAASLTGTSLAKGDPNCSVNHGLNFSCKDDVAVNSSLCSSGHQRAPTPIDVDLLEHCAGESSSFGIGRTVRSLEISGITALDDSECGESLSNSKNQISRSCRVSSASVFCTEAALEDGVHKTTKLDKLENRSAEPLNCTTLNTTEKERPECLALGVTKTSFSEVVPTRLGLTSDMAVSNDTLQHTESPIVNETYTVISQNRTYSVHRSLDLQTPLSVFDDKLANTSGSLQMHEGMQANQLSCLHDESEPSRLDETLISDSLRRSGVNVSLSSIISANARSGTEPSAASLSDTTGKFRANLETSLHSSKIAHVFDAHMPSVVSRAVLDLMREVPEIPPAIPVPPPLSITYVKEFIAEEKRNFALAEENIAFKENLSHKFKKLNEIEEGYKQLLSYVRMLTLLRKRPYLDVGAFERIVLPHEVRVLIEPKDVKGYCPSRGTIWYCKRGQQLVGFTMVETSDSSSKISGSLLCSNLEAPSDPVSIHPLTALVQALAQRELGESWTSDSWPEAQKRVLDVFRTLETRWSFFQSVEDIIIPDLSGGGRVYVQMAWRLRKVTVWFDLDLQEHIEFDDSLTENWPKTSIEEFTSAWNADSDRLTLRARMNNVHEKSLDLAAKEVLASFKVSFRESRSSKGQEALPTF